jgi:hypothetical protein
VGAEIPGRQYEYGARLEDSVDVMIPIATKNYDVALLIAEVVLREHVSPRVARA